MQNPYSTMFGKVPTQIISRAQQTSQVVESFRAKEPSQQVFVITGVRGSGKTVFMTDVASKLAEDDQWVRVELRTVHDMIESLVAKLGSNRSLTSLFADASIDLSILGVGLHVKGQAPLNSLDDTLSQMLKTLKSKGKRLLITVDEVVNNSFVRDFASLYQVLVREDLPVFLLMTGRYENVESLQKTRNLTSLDRVPTIELEPLGIRSIALDYEHTLGIRHATALEMAHLTKGYAFAFQLLGSLIWGHRGLRDEVLDAYRAQLFDLSYDKIWSELSPGDKRIANGIAVAPSLSVADIRAVLGQESNEFSPYRRRLMRKGIIDGSERGKVTFTLPLFREYVIERYGEIEL